MHGAWSDDPGAHARGIYCLKLSLISCIEIAALEQLTLSTVLIVDLRGLVNLGWEPGRLSEIRDEPR